MFLDVEVAVDQAVAERTGVGAVHRDGVADLPGGAGVLPTHAGGGGALLLLAGLVEDQHRTGRGQVTHGEAADRVAGAVLVPDGLVDQALHPERARLPGVLGHRPAVLARQIGKQAPQVVPGARPGLPAGEQRSEIRRDSSNFSWNSRGTMLTAEAV